MADVKKGGVYAAIFAAGMAAGGGGVEVMNNPDPTSYLAAGIAEVITAPCADVSDAAACEQIRDYQLGMVIDDLAEDVRPSESFALSDIELYVANRLDFDDAMKEVWVQDALQTINRRLADGYAKEDISPDDTLTGEALVAMLEAARDA